MIAPINSADEDYFRIDVDLIDGFKKELKKDEQENQKESIHTS